MVVHKFRFKMQRPVGGCFIVMMLNCEMNGASCFAISCCIPVKLCSWLSFKRNPRSSFNYI